MTSQLEIACPEHLASPVPRSWQRELLLCILAGAIGLAWACFILDLRHADWRVPLYYANPYPIISGTDGVGTLSFVKQTTEFGIRFSNPLLAWPLGADGRDYPMHDGLHVVAIWLISHVSAGWAQAANNYFVAGFLLAAMTGCWVARRLGLGQMAAVAAGVLFSCLPYPFLRGQGHFFLAMDYHVPLGVLLIARAWMGQSLFLPDGKAWSAKGAILLGMLAVIVASGGAYYALFTAGLVGPAGLVHAATRQWRRLLDAALVSGLIVLTLALIMLPSIIYRMQAGPNPSAVMRAPGQSEVYGLKIVQLLLPTVGHRVPFLASLAESYAHNTPFFNENVSSSIGLIGVFGLLVMAGRLLGWRPRIAVDPLLSALARANLVAILFAVTGGFGMLVALTLTPVLRSSNRISVFIAYFALLAAFAVIEAWRPALDSRCGKNAYRGLVVILILLGLLDLTNPTLRPNHAASLAEWQRDHTFVAAIEQRLPAGAAVFQLPYVPFPEGGGYDHLRGYLHSQSLRWSFGAVRDRECDKLHQTIAGKLGSPEFKAALTNARFAGVWLDRGLWTDDKVAAWLTQDIDPTPIASADGRFLFFAVR